MGKASFHYAHSLTWIKNRNTSRGEKRTTDDGMHWGPAARSPLSSRQVHRGRLASPAEPSPAQPSIPAGTLGQRGVLATTKVKLGGSTRRTTILGRLA